MKAVIAKKIGMTQIFLATGDAVPASMIKVDKNTVTQVKTVDQDHYQAVQVGSGFRRFVTKPVLGHLGGKKFRYLKEFFLSDQNLNVGDSWGAAVFAVGDQVQVTGTSKGKGFQGVVKRWGFHGHPATHGHKDQLRMPGAIGAGEPQHVFKGTRMGGHMGDDQITTKYLEIVRIDGDIIYVRGAVPGARNGVLYVQGEGNITKNTTEESIEPVIVSEPVAEVPAASADSEVVMPDKPVIEVEKKEELVDNQTKE
ncbi:MAG: 50S ribosomal protein L3 [Candidatus Komeilibacteria bacterium CG_4_10_14_0_2_um_filter_37_10]|uniref:50S ribosomal protein L3 n=1 Tax=Candidatus Komeilibacteria bacterium CG_4_10_14_0_2_um_filter_37_10 TaxID=1974470 RepID=A0A2M7VEC3_9BACT|nr:MAG: 50S ribosomal protein L3 [Candidatus Komeilibacteria bacterium CG_4_10_14_0_2_um_filter_37_10]